MPILEQREIRFDEEGVLRAIAALPGAARQVGLPAGPAKALSFNEEGQYIEVGYGPCCEHEPVQLKAERLGAILVSFCLWHRLPMPRRAEKTVEVRDGSVILRLRTEVIWHGCDRPSGASGLAR